MISSCLLESENNKIMWIIMMNKGVKCSLPNPMQCCCLCTTSKQTLFEQYWACIHGDNACRVMHSLFGHVTYSQSHYVSMRLPKKWPEQISKHHSSRKIVACWKIFMIYWKEYSSYKKHGVGTTLVLCVYLPLALLHPHTHKHN